MINKDGLHIIYTIKDVCELLRTAESVEEIDEYRYELQEVIPDIHIMFDFRQSNSAHPYDLWFHTLHTVVGIPRNIDDDMIYLGALLHDIGKPDSKCRSPKDNEYHYYGHQQVSYDIVRHSPLYKQVVEEYSDYDVDLLLYYVKHHDDIVALELPSLYKHLKSLTLEEFKHLMLLEVSDAKAHNVNDKIQKRIDVCGKWSSDYADEMYKKLLETHKDFIPKTRNQ